MSAPPHRGRLIRQRYLEKDGGGTIQFKLDIERLGRFFAPTAVPEFDGEEAEVEFEMKHGRPRILRIVRVTKPTA